MEPSRVVFALSSRTKAPDFLAKDALYVFTYECIDDKGLIVQSSMKAPLEAPKILDLDFDRV
jgi:hypothetical protein